MPVSLDSTDKPPRSAGRVRQHRRRRRDAGIIRVEVSVPAADAAAVRAFAQQLRDRARSEEIAQAHRLVAEAYERFGASCLDNIAVDARTASVDEIRIVAEALMQRGNSDAFLLGRKLLEHTRP